MRGIDPETGQHCADTKRYLDAIDWLGAAERDKIFRGNVEKVYPRLLRRHRAGVVSLRT